MGGWYLTLVGHTRVSVPGGPYQGYLVLVARKLPFITGGPHEGNRWPRHFSPLISMILQAQGRCKVGAQTRTRREIWTKDKGERDRDSMTILDAREAALQAEGMRGTRARTFAITCRKTSGNLLSQDLTALGLGSTCTRKEKGSGRERERERERKGESEDATGPDVCADILIDGLNPAS